MHTIGLQSPELTGLCRDVEHFTKSRISPPDSVVIRKSAALNSNLISTICTDANRTSAAAVMNSGVFRQRKKSQVKLALRNRGRARRDGKHYVSDSVIRPVSISHVSRRY